MRDHSEGKRQALSVACIRANDSCGVNDFTDNADGSITDDAAGLMCAQGDSGIDAPDGFTWEEALACVQAQNGASSQGHSGWRLPNAKELLSIVGHSRSTSSSDSAAIDPMFRAVPFTGDAGVTDDAFYRG